MVEIRPSERIVIDARTLDELFLSMGHRAAEAYVMSVVEAISDILAEVDAMQREERVQDIGPRARQVSALAGEIGLSSLSRVAGDLGIAVRRDDVVSYRAIWDRLVRIGDRSLAQVWELPVLSM